MNLDTHRGTGITTLSKQSWNRVIESLVTRTRTTRAKGSGFKSKKCCDASAAPPQPAPTKEVITQAGQDVVGIQVYDNPESSEETSVVILESAQ